MATVVRHPCDEGVIRSLRPCAEAATPADSRPWILAATILGSSMAFVDGSVTNLALPAFQRDLHATVIDAQWVIEAYALFLSALILVGGSLGDRLGRKRVFMSGVILFALASAGCGVAPNVPLLIAFRAIQGIGGALLTPGSLAIISASFSGAERGRAIGTWSGFSAVTGVIGPVLGGFLIQQASWRWVFYINLPVSAVVLAICALHVPESQDEDAAGRVDWIGALLITVGLGGLVYGLLQGQRSGLTAAPVLGSLAIGVAALAAFVMTESRVRNAMMPLNLFRSPVFSGTNLLTLLLYGGLAASFFFLPLNLIEVQGFTATAAAAAILPSILLLSVLSRWTGGLVDRWGARLPLVVGPAIAAVGFVLFAMTGTGRSYWVSFFPAAIVFGIGMAITVAPLTTTVMGAVPSSHSGVASGINNAVARAGGLIAIAVLGLLFVQRFDSALDARMAAQNLPVEVRQVMAGERNQLAAASIPRGASPAVAAQVRNDLNQSFVDAYQVVLLVTAALAVAGGLTSFVFIRPTRRRGEPIRQQRPDVEPAVA